MKCFGRVGRGPRTNRLDFGGDPDPIPYFAPIPLLQCVFSGIAIVYCYLHQVAAALVSAQVMRCTECSLVYIDVYMDASNAAYFVAVPCLFRPPGTLVPEGLTFYCRCFFPFFYSPGYLRAPSADRRETLPHDRYMGVLYNASLKIRGPSLQRNWGPKT